MAGRITKLQTHDIRDFREKELQKERERAVANERYRRRMQWYNMEHSRAASPGSDSGSSVETPCGSESRETAADDHRVPDDGYCYTAMARAGGGLQKLSTLGPSPTTGEILASPLEWFNYPLVGTVSPVEKGTCFIECREGSRGAPLDRFFTVVAMQQANWPVGSLGAELLRDRIGRPFMNGAGNVKAEDSASRCEDFIVRKKLPDKLLADVLVVSTSEGQVAALRQRYPQCTVLGPSGHYQARDIMLVEDEHGCPPDSLYRRVADAAVRTLVWITPKYWVPEVFLARSDSIYTSDFGAVPLVDISTGPKRCREGPDRPTFRQRDDDFVDDGDYLFLCERDKDKDVLRRWFPGAKDNIRTTQEACDIVVADLYRFTTEVLSQTCACPQIAVSDMSDHIGVSELGATRSYHRVSLPVGKR